MSGTGGGTSYIKIQKEYELTPTIQILDYPIAPLEGSIIEGGSTIQNPIFILLLGIVGLGFGVVVSVAKGLFSIIPEDEKKRLNSVKKEMKKTFKSGRAYIRIRSLLKNKRDYSIFRIK